MFDSGWLGEITELKLFRQGKGKLKVRYSSQLKITSRRALVNAFDQNVSSR
jgi:hypothetical protein